MHTMSASSVPRMTPWTSVATSPRWKRSAMPRTRGSESTSCAEPVPLENRTVTGTGRPDKWAASLNDDATSEAWNRPIAPMPGAWIGRVSGMWSPAAAMMASIAASAQSVTAALYCGRAATVERRPLLT